MSEIPMEREAKEEPKSISLADRSILLAILEKYKIYETDSKKFFLFRSYPNSKKICDILSSAMIKIREIINFGEKNPNIMAILRNHFTHLVIIRQRDLLFTKTQKSKEKYDVLEECRVLMEFIELFGQRAK